MPGLSTLPEPTIRPKRRRPVRTAVRVVLVLAIVVTAALLDPQVVALGAVVTFLWMTLFGMPLWIAAINQEIELEREALLGLHHG